MKQAIAAIMLTGHVSSAIAGMQTGNDLQAMSEAASRISAGRESSADYSEASRFIGYIMGVHDGLNQAIFCAPQGVTAGQLMAMVQKYLADHPERWNESGNVLVVAAIRSAFPCTERK